MGQKLAYFAFAPRPLLRARQVKALDDLQDVMVRRQEVRAYLAAHPDLEAHQLPGVGHYRMFRHEDVRGHILNFLAH